MTITKTATGKTAGKAKLKRPGKLASNHAAAKRLAAEYQRYFVAPKDTPDAFRVLDLSDGGSVSFASHT
jgi:hypothetical protein